MNTNLIFFTYPQSVGTLSPQLAGYTAVLVGHIFVSKYQLELPKCKEIEQFPEKKLKEAGGLND